MQMAQHNKSITQTQSVTLVKNLFRASFSSIAYVRDLFDDDCFAPGKIGGTKYQKIVKSQNKEVRQFVDWLELGVFDALQRQHLEVVLLELYESPVHRTRTQAGQLAKQKLIECFQFKVTYGEDGATFDMGAGVMGDTSNPLEPRAQIKQTTSDVLHALIQLTGTLQPLPPSRIISMKLMYTTQTPQDYEPPLFGKANPEDMCWFEDKQTKIAAGTVTTPYHQVSMTVHTSMGLKNRTGSQSPKQAPKQRSTGNIRSKGKNRTALPLVVATDDSTVTAVNIAVDAAEEEAPTKIVTGRKDKLPTVEKGMKRNDTKAKSLKNIAPEQKVSDTSSAIQKSSLRTRKSPRRTEGSMVDHSAKTNNGSRAKRPRAMEAESAWTGARKTRKVSQVQRPLEQ